MKGTTLLAALLVCLAGCSKDPFTKAQDEFIAGCEKSGMPEEICSCTFSKLTEVYSREGMIRIFNSGMPPPDFLNKSAWAMDVCVN